MFNSCTNAHNHFQKRYSGSSAVPEEGNSTLIFTPALSIADKQWIPARLHTPTASQRAPQPPHGFCAHVSLPRDYPGIYSWKNRNSDGKLFCCMSNMVFLATSGFPVDLQTPRLRTLKARMSFAISIPRQRYNLSFWILDPLWTSLPLSPCDESHNDLLSAGQSEI